MNIYMYACKYVYIRCFESLMLTQYSISMLNDLSNWKKIFSRLTNETFKVNIILKLNFLVILCDFSLLIIVAKIM